MANQLRTHHINHTLRALPVLCLLLIGAATGFAQAPAGAPGGQAGGLYGSSGGGGGSRPSEMTIIIRESPENLRKIEEMVRSLDVPPKQVLIETHFFDIKLDSQEQTGINWTALMTQIAAKGPLWQFNNNLGRYDTSGNPTGNGVLNFGTLENEHFQILLQGLRKNNRAKSLSNPKVIALSGQQATISVGQQIPYITRSSSVSNGVVVPQVDVKFKDIPVKLSVTPIINEDETMRLIVNPNVSTLQGYVEEVPIVEERSATTDVIMNDGETLILGGLITEQHSNTKDTVPFLGSVPVLKNFFTRTDKTLIRSELVIFISPKIIKSCRVSAGGPTPGSQMRGKALE